MNPRPRTPFPWPLLGGTAVGATLASAFFAIATPPGSAPSTAHPAALPELQGMQRTLKDMQRDLRTLRDAPVLVQRGESSSDVSLDGEVRDWTSSVEELRTELAALRAELNGARVADAGRPAPAFDELERRGPEFVQQCYALRPLSDVLSEQGTPDDLHAAPDGQLVLQWFLEQGSLTVGFLSGRAVRAFISPASGLAEH